ncbi:MAG: class I SAM-dependent methyltransferase, partial [Granulosicoccaceae bacterium]
MTVSIEQSPLRVSACNICGSTEFEPGPFGRMARNGALPRCSQCRSLERHRVIRQIYDAIPEELLASARALQFSFDPAPPEQRFKTLEVSQYGQENSLDMMDIDRKDGSYDWIIANHVLEHIRDDLLGLSELLRVLSDKGVIQLTVPSPSTELEYWPIENPDDNIWEHYHGYGSDLPLRLASVLQGCFGLQVIGTDRC